MRAPASLPMYHQPGARGAWVRLWAHVGAHLRAVGLPAPVVLSWPVHPEVHWAAPDLFLSQTCALPYRTWVHRTATVVGAFDFGLPGCAPGEYCSAILTRKGDRRDLRDLRREGVAAISAFDSQSGYAAWAELGGLPESPLVTGSHAAAVRAVRDGRADVTLIDAVSWRFLSRAAGLTSGVALRAYTAPTPGLPLITARPRMAPILRRELVAAVDSAPSNPKRWLGLRGVVARASEDYGPLSRAA